jgi:Flp pilus assembly pilin Flp
MPTIFRYVQNEQGIETLEWIAVGALIVAVALVVYPGTLQGGLQSVINTVVGKINT